jgi:hypothetical protein
MLLLGPVPTLAIDPRQCGKGREPARDPAYSVPSSTPADVSGDASGVANRMDCGALRRRFSFRTHFRYDCPHLAARLRFPQRRLRPAQSVRRAQAKAASRLEGFMERGPRGTRPASRACRNLCRVLAGLTTKVSAKVAAKSGG